MKKSNMKNYLFLINCMNGGGAEKIICNLAEYFNNHGNSLIILTGQKLNQSIFYKTYHFKVISLIDKTYQQNDNILYKCLVSFFRKIIKYKEKHHIKKLNSIVLFKYFLQNREKIKILKDIINKYEDPQIISFLDDSILLSLLSAKNKKNYISERGAVNIHGLRKEAAVRKLYKYAKCMVCQTPDAYNYYKSFGLNCKIIPNPLSENLPERYTGIRQKKIVNFCRIDEHQKNLTLLINAFKIVNEKFSDWVLEIIGEPVPGDTETIPYLNNLISNLFLKNKVRILPFRKNIHEYINDFGMFVSSSNFEGLSNSMLEAMAIGLPTICTDCDGGGARMMIKDHENGILVPKCNEQALADAMCEIIENPELAETLSLNAVNIREILNRNTICEQWYNLVNAE